MITRSETRERKTQPEQHCIFQTANHDPSVSPIGGSLLPLYSSLPVQLFSDSTMDRIFGKKKAPGPPPPSLDEASAGLDGRLGNMDGT